MLILINFKYSLSSSHFASIISFKSNLNLRQTSSLIRIIPNSSFSPHNLDQLITFYVTLACIARNVFLIFPNIHPSICIFDSQPLVSFKTLISKNRTTNSHDENKIRESYLSETLHRNTFDNVFSSIENRYTLIVIHEMT